MYHQTYLIVYPPIQPLNVVNVGGVPASIVNQVQPMVSQPIVPVVQTQNIAPWPVVLSGGLASQPNIGVSVVNTNINTNTIINTTSSSPIEKTEDYECKLCKKSYKSKITLKRHNLIHTGEKPYSCDTCGKSFLAKNYLRIHARVHSEEKSLECDVCKQTFRLKATLAAHMLRHTGEKPYKCKVCKKGFTTAGALKLHSAVHSDERPHICDICKKSFKLKLHLRDHLKVHTGEKSHVCKICQRAFTKKFTMELHMETHNVDKPYLCSICKKSFKARKYLRIHAVHHKKVKPHVCKICKKSFAVRGHLKLHYLIHTGEKAHICCICNKSFATKGNLKKHFLIHREERSRGCSVCKASFTEDEFFWKLDSEDESEENQYACECCYRKAAKPLVDNEEHENHRMNSEQSGSNSVHSDVNKESSNKTSDINIKEENFDDAIAATPDQIKKYGDIDLDIKKEIEEESRLPIKEEQYSALGEVIYCDSLSEHDIKCERPYL